MQIHLVIEAAVDEDGELVGAYSDVPESPAGFVISAHRSADAARAETTSREADTGLPHYVHTVTVS